MSEPTIRLFVFLTVLTIMVAAETLMPARKHAGSKAQRWFGNIGLLLSSTILLKLVVPVSLSGIALYSASMQWGIFNHVPMPNWLVLIVSLVLLDMLVYWQHRIFHRVAILWRIHKVHHADSHVDTSTALRFHPIEIVLSLGIKALAVVALGIPVTAVLVFEILLNGFAIFNHANIRFSLKTEHILRKLLVTQMLHRIHHSQLASETDTNFGFSVILWDKLFGTYCAQASKEDESIDIGLKEYLHASQNASLFSLLKMPFSKK